eukprot:4820069-Amphidinium_carterae.1
MVCLCSGSVELATMVYGVPIVVSQSVVEMCSSDVSSKCRLIDCVIIRALEHAHDNSQQSAARLSGGALHGVNLNRGPALNL